MTIRKLRECFNEHKNSANWKTKTVVGANVNKGHQERISALKLVQIVQRD